MLFIWRSFGPRPVPSYFFLTKHLQISQLHKQNMPTAAIIGDISPIPSVSSSGTNTRTGVYASRSRAIIPPYGTSLSRAAAASAPQAESQYLPTNLDSSSRPTQIMNPSADNTTHR